MDTIEREKGDRSARDWGFKVHVGDMNELCSYDKTFMKLEQHNMQPVETHTHTHKHVPVDVWWSETGSGWDGFFFFF